MSTSNSSTLGAGSPPPGPTETTGPCAATPRRRVTDAPTRLVHALFALSFAVAWLTGDSEHWRRVHLAAGYLMVALVAWRAFYALWGPPAQRLAPMLRRLAAWPSWLRSLGEAWRSPAGRLAHARQGSFLLMATLTTVLLGAAVPLLLSGHAAVQEWGGRLLAHPLEEMHEFLANALLAVALAHVGLVAVLTLTRGSQQATPMITGRVPGRGPDLVRSNRAGLALVLLAAWLALGAWLWTAGPASANAAGPDGSPAVTRHGGHDDDD